MRGCRAGMPSSVAAERCLHPGPCRAGAVALGGEGASSSDPHQRSAFPSSQEIDGKALLLLRSDMMMKYMGLKLGPALKLTYHIDKLKQGKF